MIRYGPQQQEEQWREIVRILHADYEQADLVATRVILSSVAAHRIVAFSPVWMMAVAPSGSMKTAMLESLDGLPGIFFVDEVTPQTFISGKLEEKRKKRQTPASFLHRIGSEGVLIAADFSTVLSMDERNRAKILAQLRRIYDGHFSREFGTDENLEERDWKGRLTFLTGVTPDVDSHYSVYRSLGERFVQVRWPRAGGVSAGLKALRKRKEAPQELRNAVHAFMSPILGQASVLPPSIPEHIEVRIAHLGEFTALARTRVQRERSTHEVQAEASPEGNTRLPQEFAQLGRGSAVLAGRQEVSEEDFGLVRRAAFDCIPAVRRAVLEALLQNRSAYSLGIPAAVVSRACEDLVAVGLIEPSARLGHQIAHSTLRLVEGFDSSPKTHSNERGLEGYALQIGGS
jgi:hypothetical protein